MIYLLLLSFFMQLVGLLRRMERKSHLITNTGTTKEKVYTLMLHQESHYSAHLISLTQGQAGRVLPSRLKMKIFLKEKIRAYLWKELK